MSQRTVLPDIWYWREMGTSALIMILCVVAIVIIDPMTQRGLTESACQFGIPFIFFCMEYCNAALFV